MLCFTLRSCLNSSDLLKITSSIIIIFNYNLFKKGRLINPIFCSRNIRVINKKIDPLKNNSKDWNLV